MIIISNATMHDYAYKIWRKSVFRHLLKGAFAVVKNKRGDILGCENVVFSEDAAGRQIKATIIFTITKKGKADTVSITSNNQKARIDVDVLRCGYGSMWGMECWDPNVKKKKKFRVPVVISVG